MECTNSEFLFLITKHQITHTHTHKIKYIIDKQKDEGDTIE